MEVLIIVGIVALIGLVAYFGYLAAKKRREAMEALARDLGWRFYPGNDSSHDEEYSHFEIFRRGHGRVAFNTLVGRVEADNRTYPAKAGDFRYKVTSGTGKNRRTSTYTFSYLILHLPFPRTPDLLIRPEGFFDKIAGAFGFDDIDFESAEFSRRFHVKSSDKRFAYDVIHPRMMEYLLDVRAPMIDIEQGRCCLSNGRTRWQPEDFRNSIRFLREFLDLWPDHLTAQLES
ncbi:MAG: DUF3137 domain-containing protein [Planctomycetota bacterium]